MSAADHRAHAAAEEKKAEEQEKKYNPDASADKMVQGPGFFDTVTYNPTAHHAAEAEEHREHAEAHRKAAAALEKFEEAECKSFPPETRKECPLLGTVKSVEDVDDGVRIRLADDVNQEAALAHVKCHIAYANKMGREGMDDCPLYIKGVSAKAGDADHVIELTLDDDAELGELRKRSQDHVAP
jgi:hypothetical protein